MPPAIRNRISQTVGRALGSLEGSPREKDHEFFSAKAAQNIILPAVLPGRSRYRLQNPVAGGMAKSVIDPLEMIKIEQYAGQRFRDTAHLLQFRMHLSIR